jgi:beta-N-acetylglucosaminidase
MNSIERLDFDWQDRAPYTGGPSDRFSAIFYKKIVLDADGDYSLHIAADDGVRVYINGELQVDMWQDGVNSQSKTVVLQKGTNLVKVEYYENTGMANVQDDLKKLQDTRVYEYSTYPWTLDQIFEIQWALSPQTDKRYDTYVRSDAFLIDDPQNPTMGITEGSGWRVRGGPGTQYWAVGRLNDGEKVDILGVVQAADGWKWYKIKYDRTWVNASPSDVKYYINPENFNPNSPEYFQFLVLSRPAGLNIDEVNEKILRGKGILEGKAAAFVEAAKAYSINEVYLISHALLETGDGRSKLANGVLVDTVNGQPVEPKVVYNMYGINAKDSCPVRCGAEYAYQQGWFTPEAAIIGGAKFIGQGYIHNGQDTLYKMRWNPEQPGTHQYATDIAWAVKQTYRIQSLYGLLSQYSLVFDIPKYE